MSVLAALTYVPSLRNGFAYDDVVIVADNVRIHHWSTLPSALTLAYWYTTGHLYRPLTTLSLGIEWLLGGGSPVVFHAFSAILHALVAGLVSRIALRWASLSASLSAGVVFAVYPVHVEAVSNVVGQSELLCAASLAALMLVASSGAISSSDQPSPGARPRRYLPWLVAALSGCALASKETGAVAPLLTWAASRLPQHSQDSTEKPGLRGLDLVYASCAGVAGIVLLRLTVLGTLIGEDPHPAFLVAGHTGGALLALASLPRALAAMVVPAAPRPDYSPSDEVIANPSLLLVFAGIALIGIAVVSMASLARRPTLVGFAVTIAAIALLPVSNLFVRTGVVVAERTLYSPSIGVALLASALVSWAARGTRIRRGVSGALIALAATVGLYQAERAIPIWRDTESVTAAMETRAPESYRGPALRARGLRATGRYREAGASYALAIGRFSGDVTILHDAAANALMTGDTARALTWLQRGLAVDPAELQVRTDLVHLALHHGDSVDARQLLIDGLRIAPEQRTWRATLIAISAQGSRSVTPR